MKPILAKFKNIFLSQTHIPNHEAPMSNPTERDRIAKWIDDNRKTLDTLRSNLDAWRRWLEEWQAVDQTTWQDYKLDSMEIRSLVIFQLGTVEEIEEDFENPELASLMRNVAEGISEINARIRVLDRLVGGLPAYNWSGGRRPRAG